MIVFVKEQVKQYASPVNGSSSCRGRVDVCGVCHGKNRSCLDCAGVPNGKHRKDLCGYCSNDAYISCRSSYKPIYWHCCGTTPLTQMLEATRLEAEGTRHMQAHRHGAAIASFEAAFALDPANTELRQMVSFAKFVVAGSSSVDDALKLDETEEAARLAAEGERHMRARRYGEAAASFEAALAVRAGAGFLAVHPADKELRHLISFAKSQVNISFLPGRGPGHQGWPLAYIYISSYK